MKLERREKPVSAPARAILRYLPVLVGANAEIQERNRDNSETKAEVQLYKKHQEILAATKQATANIVRLTAKFDAISGIWQLVTDPSYG